MCHINIIFARITAVAINDDVISIASRQKHLFQKTSIRTSIRTITGIIVTGYVVSSIILVDIELGIIRRFTDTNIYGHICRRSIAVHHVRRGAAGVRALFIIIVDITCSGTRSVEWQGINSSSVSNRIATLSRRGIVTWVVLYIVFWFF